MDVKSANHCSFASPSLSSLIYHLSFFFLPPSLPLPSPPKEQHMQYFYNMKFQGLLIILPLLQTVLDQVMVNCTVVVDFKDMSKTGYLEIFDTGGNVLFIKLFTEIKHM